MPCSKDHNPGWIESIKHFKWKSNIWASVQFNHWKIFFLFLFNAVLMKWFRRHLAIAVAILQQQLEAVFHQQKDQFAYGISTCYEFVN